MSNDIEQFKKWLDAFMHVSAMAGIEDHERVPTWPHYTDRDKEMFKGYPQLTVGAVRALADQLEEFEKIKAKAKTEAVQEFVTNMVGAYDSGFTDTPNTNLATIYRCMQHHCKDNYGADVPNLADVFDGELLNDIRKKSDGDLQKTSAALLAAQERAARAEERLKLLSEALYRVSDKLSACPPDCLGTGRSTEVNVPPWSIRDEVIHDIKNSIIDAIKVQS